MEERKYKGNTCTCTCTALDNKLNISYMYMYNKSTFNTYWKCMHRNMKNWPRAFDTVSALPPELWPPGDSQPSQFSISLCTCMCCQNSIRDGPVTLLPHGEEYVTIAGKCK